MKRAFAILSVGAALLVSCGYDREGSADQLIEDIESTGTDLTADQEKCLRDIVTDMSDDELEAVDKNTLTAEQEADLQEKFAACLIG